MEPNDTNINNREQHHQKRKRAAAHWPQGFNGGATTVSCTVNGANTVRSFVMRSVRANWQRDTGVCLLAGVSVALRVILEKCRGSRWLLCQ